MIIDTIDNLLFYKAINPRIQFVCDFVNSHNLNSFHNCTVEIDGQNVFANFCSSPAKTKTEAQVETHNQMLDIQIPLSCEETMGYIPRKKLPDGKYDANKDVTFYNNKPQQYINVNPGEFVIFFPQDGHAPCISDEAIINKVIFKVKV